MNSDETTANNASYDIGLLFPVLFLVGIGIVMVYSASSAVALKKYGSDFLFLKKQALFALIGLDRAGYLPPFSLSLVSSVDLPAAGAGPRFSDCDPIHRLWSCGRWRGQVAAFREFIVSTV